MMDEKPFWHSRTMWVNVVTLLLIAIAAIMSQGLVSDDVAKWLAVAITVLNAVINLFLRADTNTLLTFRK